MFYHNVYFAKFNSCLDSLNDDHNTVPCVAMNRNTLFSKVDIIDQQVITNLDHFSVAMSEKLIDLISLVVDMVVLTKFNKDRDLFVIHVLIEAYFCKLNKEIDLHTLDHLDKCFYDEFDISFI